MRLEEQQPFELGIFDTNHLFDDLWNIGGTGFWYWWGWSEDGLLPSWLNSGLHHLDTLASEFWDWYYTDCPSPLCDLFFNGYHTLKDGVLKEPWQCCPLEFWLIGSFRSNFSLKILDLWRKTQERQWFFKMVLWHLSIGDEKFIRIRLGRTFRV